MAPGVYDFHVTGDVTCERKAKDEGINIHWAIISKMAGDTRTLAQFWLHVTQGHTDIFGWKYLEEC